MVLDGQLHGDSGGTPARALASQSGRTRLDCVPTFKLKGLFPRFAWCYETGYAAQESVYVPCGSEANADPSAGGVLGLPH